MKRKRNAKNTLNDFASGCAEIHRRIEQGDFEWHLDMPNEHALALGLVRRDRYLTCPTGPCFLLQAVHIWLCELRGRAAVMLYPSGEARWRISVICPNSSPLADLRRSAERIGVEVETAQPEVGGFTGWIDANNADFVAWRLSFLRTGPNRAKRRSLRSARRNGPTPASARTDTSRE